MYILAGSIPIDDVTDSSMEKKPALIMRTKSRTMSTMMSAAMSTYTMMPAKNHKKRAHTKPITIGSATPKTVRATMP